MFYEPPIREKMEVDLRYRLAALQRQRSEIEERMAKVPLRDEATLKELRRDRARIIHHLRDIEDRLGDLGLYFW